MTDDREQKTEIATLAQLRDEVRLKAHLLKAELRDELEDLERRWHAFERDTRPAREAVDASAREIGASTRGLFDSLVQGYRRVRDSLGTGHA